ncbi:hypothetical protein BGZ94_000822 [Podila epigama]|nr:hypothetical protein BGZ94_000822 [Podila epigama]
MPILSPSKTQNPDQTGSAPPTSLLKRRASRRTPRLSQQEEQFQQPLEDRQSQEDHQSLEDNPSQEDQQPSSSTHHATRGSSQTTAKEIDRGSRLRNLTVPWRTQFKDRTPFLKADGGFSLPPYAPRLSLYYHRKPRVQSDTQPSKDDTESADNTALQTDQNKETDGQQPEETGEEQPNTTSGQQSKPDNGPSPTSFDQGSLVDLAPMEEPYLQEAYPYEFPPKSRVKHLDLEWYKPQGPVAVEDYFTERKLQCSVNIMKKIDYRSEELPMEQYYARGFDMAAQVVLDRERARVVKESIATRKPPTLPKRGKGRKSKMTQEGVPSDQQSSSDEESDLDEQMEVEAQTSTATSADDHGISLMDYYQVNKFLAYTFNTSARKSELAPLSTNSCRILQSLMGDLEARLLAMGCHRQRRDLTWKLANVDVKQAVATNILEALDVGTRPRRASKKAPKIVSRKRRLYERLEVGNIEEDLIHWERHSGRTSKGVRNKKIRLDSAPPTEPGSESSSSSTPTPISLLDSQSPFTGSSVTPTTPLPISPTISKFQEQPKGALYRKQLKAAAEARRPFVYNPLEVDLAMDPFLKAREFLANRFFQEQAAASAMISRSVLSGGTSGTVLPSIPITRYGSDGLLSQTRILPPPGGVTSHPQQPPLLSNPESVLQPALQSVSPPPPIPNLQSRLEVLLKLHTESNRHQSQAQPQVPLEPQTRPVQQPQHATEPQTESLPQSRLVALLQSHAQTHSRRQDNPQAELKTQDPTPPQSQTPTQAQAQPEPEPQPPLSEPSSELETQAQTEL